MRIFNALALNVDQFLGSFEYMWKGMLCIFIVIGILIVSIYLLNKASNAISAKKQAKED